MASYGEAGIKRDEERREKLLQEAANSLKDRAAMRDATGYAVPGGIAETCRMSARGAVEDRIRRLHVEAAQLQALLDALPAKLSPEADQALWTIVIERR